MLERMPALNLAELKAGDALIISSTKGAEPDKITAITLLAGVEALAKIGAILVTVNTSLRAHESTGTAS
jgi:hypothetical protein